MTRRGVPADLGDGPQMLCVLQAILQSDQRDTPEMRKQVRLTAYDRAADAGRVLDGELIYDGEIPAPFDTGRRDVGFVRYRINTLKSERTAVTPRAKAFALGRPAVRRT